MGEKQERGILMIFKWMNESEISIEGDFILKVKVSHDFKETYDSASVMVIDAFFLLLTTA